MRFRDLSIKSKLILSTHATTVIALLLASAAFMFLHVTSFIEAVVDDLSSQAVIIRANCVSAILLDDPDAAASSISSLKAESQVSSAFILDKEGNLFAEYHCDTAAPVPSLKTTREAGYRVVGKHLYLWDQIVSGPEAIGDVVIVYDLDELYEHFFKYCGLLMMIILLSGGISHFPAVKIHHIITAPLLGLADHMKRVSLEKDYTLRIPSDYIESGNSETNLLVSGFNEMLSEIEARDRALEKHQASLEAQVAERTRELSETNRNLERAIEEAKEAKELADMANVAKSDFLANMSHELRTPLNHIIGFTELVVAKHFGDLNESQEEYLGDVLTSSRHLLALVNDILDLSKVEAGKLELRPSTVDLKHLLKHSLLMIKEKALKHRLKLATDLEALPDTVEADERKLKQIVYNLLANAVKFTPDGGKIELSARPVIGPPRPPDACGLAAGGLGLDFDGSRRWVTICVRDTGIGIDKKDLSRIFKPFEQVESSRSRKFQGTGLGLSLVNNLVELHGGLLWVESDGKDRGAVFTVAIPAETLL